MSLRGVLYGLRFGCVIIMRHKKSIDKQLENAVEYYIARAMGVSPKEPLIIEGAMHSRHIMIDEMRHLSNFGSKGDYVLSNGTWFEGRGRVDDYEIAIEWKRRRRPRGGQCFKNAREFCLAHQNVRYFEGFYLIFETPLDHAWVVMDDHKVVDFTLEAVIRKLKRDKDKVHVRPPLYLGVEVPRDKLHSLHEAVESNEPILELYKNLSRDQSH